MGNFEPLYPLKKGISEEQDGLIKKYDDLLIKSKEIWEDSIAGGGYAHKKKVPETPVS